MHKRPFVQIKLKTYNINNYTYRRLAISFTLLNRKSYQVAWKFADVLFADFLSSAKQNRENKYFSKMFTSIKQH